MKKVLLMLIVIASVTANVGFLSGCASFHNAVYGTPCKFASGRPVSSPSTDGGKVELASIASLLGIKTAGKSASDLASDIRYVLDRNIQVPATLTDEEMKEVASLFSNTKAGKVKDLQRFVSNLQDKRVIVVSPED